MLGHRSLASVNGFWILTAENEATPRSVRFCYVLSIRILFHFIICTKNVMSINREHTEKIRVESSGIIVSCTRPVLHVKRTPSISPTSEFGKHSVLLSISVKFVC